jgi:hypothetical protein
MMRRTEWRRVTFDLIGAGVVLAVLIALSLLLALRQAHSEPPPGAKPDGPIAHWFQSLQRPDTSGVAVNCCDIADCRAVRYRVAGDHYEAWIDAGTFPDDPNNSFHGHAPNSWVVVPADAVLKRFDNPTGEAVVCWYDRQIRCFVEASGT